MRTWYYAVEVRYWIVALLWSHGLLVYALLRYFVSLPDDVRMLLTAGLGVFFGIVGTLWYRAGIVPLREFRREFGFWPGRTEEERKATSDAVIETIRRRATIVCHLTEELDSMGPRDRIERDAMIVDINQEEERFREALLAAAPRYADFGVHHDSAWQTWCRPQSDSIGIGEPASPPATVPSA